MHFVTTDLEEAEWPGSRPGRFIPDERATSTNWLETGWSLQEVDLMVGAENLSKRRYSSTRARGLTSKKTPIVKLILTLRLLMSYIYIYIYMERIFLMFLDHTQRRTTVGRTPLDE